MIDEKCNAQMPDYAFTKCTLEIDHYGSCKHIDDKGVELKSWDNSQNKGATDIKFALDVIEKYGLNIANPANFPDRFTVGMSVPIRSKEVVDAVKTQLKKQRDEIETARNNRRRSRGQSVIASVLALLVFCLQPLAVKASTTERMLNRLVYFAATPVFASASSATDIFSITGSATCRIRIIRIELTGTQTTAGKATVSLIKRSTADTAGTAITPVVPANSSSPPNSSNPGPAATALVQYNTSNPASLGVAVGTLMSRQILIPAAASLVATDSPVLFLEDNYSEPITLNNAAETFAVNLNGGTFAGSQFNVNIEWEEQQN